MKETKVTFGNLSWPLKICIVFTWFLFAVWIIQILLTMAASA